MKMFRKTEDRAIDNLLRAQAGRAGGPPPLCQEFDPDLANAYIEHSLAASEGARYEQHLSLCASCRKSVVALARMAEADTVFAASESKPRRVIWEPPSRWKALAGAMLKPQWAMAAAAVMILVISVPLFMSRRGGGVNQEPRQYPVAQPSLSTDASSEAKATEENHAAAIAGDSRLQLTQSRQAANAQQEMAALKSAPSGVEAGEAAERPSNENAAGAGSGAVARSEPPQSEPVEAKAADQKADQIASKEISQVPVPADVPAPPQAAPENQLAKINSEEARRLPEQSKDKAEVSVLQPSRPDGDQRARRDGVVRPGEIAPPPPPASGTRGRNAMTAPPAGINSRLTDSARHNRGAGERKIGSKKFWLKDGTWVDKDYNPDKAMPVVTFVRDSDVYKEHLTKRQSMKSVLTGFAENERVILIYKGTVYIIVPQEGNK